MTYEQMVHRLWRLVAAKHHMSVVTLQAAKRNKNIVRARAEMYLALRRATTLSYPQIGELVGKHHTTVMHACQCGTDVPTTELESSISAWLSEGK